MTEKPIALVVDDDKEWLSILEDILESNYQVLKAKTLSEVNKLIDNKGLKIKIALVDIRLDDEKVNKGTGLSAMLTLNEAGVPCIAITSYDNGDAIRAALVEGRAKDVWFKNEKNVHLKVKIAKIGAATVEGNSNTIRSRDFNKEFIKLVLSLLLVPFVILALLIVTILLLPDKFALVIGIAITLILAIFVLLALFYNKITGEQFTQLIKIILKKDE